MRRKNVVLRAVCSLLLVLCCTSKLFAQQTGNPSVKNEYTFSQKVVPITMEKYLFSTYYYNGNKSYNLRALAMGKVAGEIQSMKVNPAGTSFATLSSSGDKKTVTIFDL